MSSPAAVLSTLRSLVRLIGTTHDPAILAAKVPRILVGEGHVERCVIEVGSSRSSRDGLHAISISEGDARYGTLWVDEPHDRELLADVASLLAQAFALHAIERDQRKSESDLHALHESVRKQETRFRRALDSIPDAIGLYDRDLRFVFVNEALASRVERDAELVVGLRPADIWSAEVCALFVPALIATRDDKRVQSIEMDVPGEGDVRYRLLFAPILDERGEVSEVVAVAHDLTQEKRAERALRERLELGERLTRIGQSVPGVLCSIRRHGDGRWTMPFASNRALEVLGFTAAELAEDLSLVIGRLGEEAREHATHALRSSAESCGLLYLEWAYPHPKAGDRWLEMRALPTVDGDSIVWHGVITDITEQKTRALASEQSDTLFRTMFEAAAIGAALTAEGDGHFVRVNERFCELVGYGRAELGSMTFADLAAPDPRSHGERCPNSRFRHRDGHIVWLDISETPLVMGAERFRLAVVQDVGGRRLAERSLRESEQRYRSLIDNLEDVVFSVDESHRILFVSEAVTRYGYVAADLVGRPFTEIIHPDDLVRTLVLLGRRLEGEIGSTEFRILDRAKKVRHVRVSSRLVTEREGQREVRGVLVDLTLQRETEAQLRLAQKMEAVGRLAGGVAHDFNNILTVISSYCQFALDAVREDDPLHPDLLEISRASERASGLTRQLLAFSRKQVLQPRALRVSALIDSMANMLERLIGEDIQLLVLHASPEAMTEADPGQIEQVVMNLVVNSRDAMKDGGTLTVSTGVVDLALDDPTRPTDLAPGKYVTLTVSDTGSGMDDETRAKVFDPFFTTKEEGKGTGLGLATVYGIVRQSGGAIEVSSRLGKGATFRALLPRVEGLESEATPPPSRVERAPNHETILVVEDEEVVRRLVQRTLVAAGYEVVVCANPGDALLHCERSGKDVSLLLTDVIMPGMNGVDLARRLAPLLPRARVLLMSGYTRDVLVDVGLGFELLQKPFSASALTRKVRRILLGAERPPDNAHLAR